MQARHRRVGIGEEIDQPAAVVEAREPRERVVEAEVGEHPRRGGRQQHVAHETDHVREQDRVSEADEGLMAAEIDPEQRECDDRELGVPVRPGSKVHQELRGVDEALERQLDQPVHVPLEADHLQAVVERLGRISVGDASCGLVREEKPEPDGELFGQVPPPARKHPASCGHERRHTRPDDSKRPGGSCNSPRPRADLRQKSASAKPALADVSAADLRHRRRRSRCR